ncbi:GGDEF domain-containing protein [Vibrio sinensis]|uniref:diguanylate cyclase n=1 Tax=Vibrio sinensis TaxID=2302434 RepID=A0A3A6R3S4_9VIBR|nr:GGDEF domain-containing protein [Vibrio sinensis]RJX75569.1 GGDEF domain-containing protein [Vibrio sinensis]
MINNSKKLDLLIITMFALLLTLVIIRSKYEDVNNELIQNFRYLSDSIYRYQINTMNSISIESDKYHDMIVLNTPGEPGGVKEVKDVEKELHYLKSTLENNLVVSDSLWTVANVFPKYMFVTPFRAEYVEHVNDNINNDGLGYFNYLLNSDGVESELNFDTTIYETISVFGPYQEITKENIFTITFPLYIDRQVKSIIIIDVKSDFISVFLDRYNFKNFSFFKLSENKSEIGRFVFNTLAMQNINSGYKSIIDISSLYIILVFTFFFILFLCVSYIISNVNSYVRNNSIDQLTGMYKRDKYKLSENSRRVNCMAIVDIDFFKKINDSFGHAKGDDVITEVCARITKVIGPSDVAIRWGGEEFVIIYNNVLDVIEFTSNLEELLFSVNREYIVELPVTVSIGGVFSKEKLAFTEAFIHADKALYDSKNSGRNRKTIIKYGFDNYKD